jgi:hypothetical protein
MTNRKRPGRRLVFLAATTLIVISTVSVAVVSKRKQQPKPRKEAATFKAERVTSLPPVSSKVKGLEISSVRLINQGTPQAALAITVLNNTDFSGYGVDGLDDPLNPHVVIEPNSLKTIEWGLGEILEGYPVFVSAASFGDGKEEGDSREIEIMHRDRARSKAKREGAAKKEATPQ